MGEKNNFINILFYLCNIKCNLLYMCTFKHKGFKYVSTFFFAFSFHLCVTNIVFLIEPHEIDIFQIKTGQILSAISHDLIFILVSYIFMYAREKKSSTLICSKQSEVTLKIRTMYQRINIFLIGQRS